MEQARCSLSQPRTAKTFGFIDFLGQIDGSGGDYLKMPAGGSRLPASEATVRDRMHFVKQDGGQVFKFAVKKMSEMCEELLARNGFHPETTLRF